MIQYKNKWLGSYETIGFDTSDGDLDFGQYAKDESGTGYYIRTKPKTETQFDWVDLKYDVSKLEEVKIKGKAYYDEFLTAEGAEAIWGENKSPEIPSNGKLRLPSTAKKYWDTAQIKNYPQPERYENVEELPPPEPLPILPEHHSIALDVASNSGWKGAVSSYSWSHTCTGSNLLLAVGDAHKSGESTDKTVTGITYNGDALTYIRSDVKTIAWTSSHRTTIYYMVAPDTGGSYTIAVTYSGTIANAGGGGAVSYTGAKQTGQPDAHNGAVGGSNKTATVNVTTVADNSWVFAVMTESSLEDSTPNNTQRWEISSSGVYISWGQDTNGPKTPAGSVTSSWTWVNANAVWAISAASFAPATAATSIKTINGLAIDSVKTYNGLAIASVKTLNGLA